MGRLVFMQITYPVLTLVVAIMAGIVTPVMLFIWANVRAARREADKHKDELKTSLLTIQHEIKAHGDLDREMFEGLDKRVENLEGVIYHGRRFHYSREDREGEHPA